MRTPGSRLKLEHAERDARQRLLDAYTAACGDYAKAVFGRESFEALEQLRRINGLLREQGISYPLGAAGVQDLITSMGVIQFHEDEAALLLKMADAAAGEWPEFMGIHGPCADLIRRLERALGKT